VKRLAALLFSLLALAGCASSGPAPGPSGGASAGASGTTGETLTVFAAASLKGAFTKIGLSFEGERPGVKVAFNFDGSSALVDQLAAGAPADVLATADEKNMTRAVDAKVVSGTPRVFATNVLTLVVPAGNPARITGLDASLAGKKLVICAVGVPCGNATETLAKNLGATLKPVSTEQKVTDVLGKVTSGEADAGIVYTTDAAAAGDKVQAVAIPGSEKVVNRYPVAATAAAKDAGLAAAFADYVTGEQGRAVLAEFGFGAP